jgi:hypothetical protein
MKYIHNETGEVWTDAQTSTSRTSNFYLLSHNEKVSMGWVLQEESVSESSPVLPRSIEESKEAARVSYISHIKARATEHIMLNYPQYKQINAILGIYGEEYKNNMISFIQNVRSTVERYETYVSQDNFEFEVIF